MFKQFRYIIIILLFVLTCSTLEASRGLKVQVKTRTGKTIPLYTDYYALVIGVGDYQKGWPRLPNPTKDAKEVADTLKELGFKVKLVRDPTSRELKSHLSKLISEGRDSTKAIVLYFAGHGHTLEEAGGKPLGYIIAKDVPDPDIDLVGFLDKAVSMRDIETCARLIKSKHVLMVFDSCFSGAIFGLVRDKPSPYIEEKISLPVREFITAGNEKEKVPDISVFKEVFIQGLKGRFADRNKDGYVTGQELGNYLEEKVVNYSNKRQHPQFAKINDPRLDKGDFVFKLADISTTGPETLKLHKPSGAGFSLDDLENKAKQIDANKIVWNDNLEEMKKAFNQVQSLHDSYLPINDKAAAWNRFLTVFSEDNPYSQEDDKLRKEASYWQKETERLEKEERRKRKESLSTAKEKEGERELKRQVTKVDLEKTPNDYKDPVTGIEFVFVNGGCYQMGDTFGDGRNDEKPVHEVCVDGFYIGKYEVTQGEWQRVMGNNPSSFKKGDNYPVEGVSWNDVQDFIRKLNKKREGKYRLPTEAEWEFAARSGGKKEKWAGISNESDLKKYAWYYANSSNKTHPVGQKKSNGLGLYDMSGNVWEWCSDWYSDDYYKDSPKDNPKGARSGSYRVFRGGSWYFLPRYVRASGRNYNTPDYRGSGLGFRLARTP